MKWYSLVEGGIDYIRGFGNMAYALWVLEFTEIFISFGGGFRVGAKCMALRGYFWFCVSDITFVRLHGTDRNQGRG